MKFSVFVFTILSFLFIHSWAQVDLDLKIIQKIKKEARENSHVLETAEYICDVHGPRLTASPNYHNAANWAVKTIQNWGIENCQLDEWGNFGRGWQVDKVTAEMTMPTNMPLIAYPKAWTGSTKGIVSGLPILIEDTNYDQLEKLKGTLSGKIVLFGKPRKPEIHFEPDARRLTDSKLNEIIQAPDMDKKTPLTERIKKWNQRKKARLKINKFLEEENVGAVLYCSEREHGTIRVHRGGSYKVGDSSGPPSMVVSAEQYNRIWRMIEKKIEVQLRIEIKNTFFENDSLGRNVIAEILGKNNKLNDQVVMVGAHLDSWHGGTGATDNGANCAVIMESIRIINALNLDNKRTIRMCLWDGEEQGYKGSEGYINKYIGNLESLDLKEEHERISAYLNLDNGAGKIRGIYLQENDAARPIFSQLFEPFKDMGVESITIKNTSGTDHIPFNKIGIPGFQFIQDPINYMNRTHHTNMDVIDNVIESDLIHNSIIIASILYHLANMPEKMPRKSMPTLDENRKYSW